MSQVAAAAPAKTKAKGKLAIYWAASCGGCEISILQIDAKILDVAEAFDIVLWPCATDGKVHDIEKMADGAIDVCLFNGSVRTSEQDYMAQLLRRKSKVLVAFGSCASEGCIPGLANMNDRRSICSANNWPSAAEAHTSRTRSGSSPMATRVCLSMWYRRMAL